MTLRFNKVLQYFNGSDSLIFKPLFKYFLYRHLLVMIDCISLLLFFGCCSNLLHFLLMHVLLYLNPDETKFL